MKAKHIVFLVIFLMQMQFISCGSWKVFFYCDSSDHLSDMIIKNITDMMRAECGQDVEFLIQLHAYYQVGLRYKIVKNNLQFIEEVTLSSNQKQNFFDACNWAFRKCNADHTMLIISNHGYGILDPSWDEKEEKWKIAGMDEAIACDIKRSMHDHQHHKGFIFSVMPRDYVKSSELFDGIAKISTGILHKKIDILAFDTCMGVMYEIACQVAPHVHCFVGNQTCSLLDGFNYQGIMPLLNENRVPSEVACGMVQAFDRYYTDFDESGIYTHTALNLPEIDTFTQVHEKCIALLLKMPQAQELLSDMPMQVPRFCLWPMYTDLIAFWKIIEERLSQSSANLERNTLQQSLQDLYAANEKLVIARCGGHKTHNKAHGMAIYLPHAAIDESYGKTNFTNTCSWIKLLSRMIAGNYR